MEPLYKVWFYRLLFLVLGFLILVINLVPIGFGSTYLTFPDLLFCLTVSWILRRPNYVPAPMVVAIFLFQDILLGLPIGLGTFLMLALMEYFRSRKEFVRYQSFLMEWGMVATGYLIFILIYQLLLTITFSHPSSLGPLVFQFMETILLYPAMVLLTTRLLKVNSSHFPLKMETN